MEINLIFDHIFQLPQESKEELKKYITEVSFPKGHILVKAGSIEKSIYFIRKGVVRAFAPLEEQDVTFWFGEEGETILSMRSYVESKKGYENIELLEDCELYELRIEHLRQLYEQDIHITNWGRKLAENELLKLESRIVATNILSAKERYDKLMKDSPSLIQRIPLKYIASYLNMTQVSLSRIRKMN